MSLHSHLFGRQTDNDREPWVDASIYRWIEAHVDRVSGRLKSGSADLPDNQAASAGTKIRWAAGALDGVSSYHVGKSKEKAMFRQFADEWCARRGYQLVRPHDNDSRLNLICGFVLPGTEPPMTFGEKPVADITTGDIEAYRHRRRMQKRSPVTINHDLAKRIREEFEGGSTWRRLERDAQRVRIGYREVELFKPDDASGAVFHQHDFVASLFADVFL